jgi:hypothetical protein
VQDRVEGAVIEAEEARAALFDLHRELVAVLRPAGQDGQDQDLVAALGQVRGDHVGVGHGEACLSWLNVSVVNVSILYILTVDILLAVAGAVKTICGAISAMRRRVSGCDRYLNC